MKRVLSLFLSCIFILGVCFSTPIVASAAEDTFSDTEYTYVLLPDRENECAITKYTGSKTDVEINSGAIAYNGNLYTITQINAGAFSDCSQVETITIKSNITTIEPGAFIGCTALTKFIENENSLNSNFEVVDGVLFNQGKTTLIAYPAAKADTEYTIPSDVTKIADGAFSGCANLSYIFNLSESDLSLSEELEIVVHTSACVEGAVSYATNNEGNVITATCNNEACKKERGTLTLVSDDVIVYDGEPHAVDVVVSGTVADYSEETVVLYTDNANPDKEGTSEAPKDAGDYTAKLVLVQADANNETEEVSATKQFTIEPKTIIATLEINENGVAYNGEVHTPTVKFTDTAETPNEVTLNGEGENADYTVEYANNVNAGTDTATATVTLKDKGNYTFGVKDEKQVYEKVLNYTINKKDLTIDITTDKLYTTNDLTDLEYTTEGLVGDDTTIESIIFKTTEENTEQSTYKVTIDTIVIKNNETDVTENYNVICSKVITITECNHSPVEGKEATCQNKAVCITCGEEYGELANHNWGFTADGAKITATCQNGGCDFGTKAVEITLTAPTDGLVYDKNEKTANVTVSAENTGIRIPEIVYSGDRRNVTEDGYTAAITLGDGENVATATINLKITSKLLTDNDVTITGLENSYVYTGSAIEPSVVVKDGDDTLVEGTDYDVAYSDNTNVGTATVTITFKGNYSGTVEKTFEIVAHKHLWSYVANAESSTITATCTGEGNCGVKNQTATITLKLKDNSDWVYNNTEKKFASVEGSIDGVTLPEIVYSGDCINAGDYTASITLGEATVSVKFTISKATPVVSDFSVTTPENLTYDGETKKVNVSCGADIGDITVEYYSEGVLLKTYPIEPGTYTFKLQVKENNNYNSATLENDAWNFTIIECKHEWVNGVCKTCNTVCEHKFDSPEITKNPTCNAPGELTWVCTVCKYSKITTVNPNGDGKTHDWSGDYVVTKAATCVSEGVETKTCKNGCGETTTRPIEKDTDAHVMGEWVITEQTCVADGKKVRTCTLGCGATETEVIKADNKSHKLPDEWTVTKEANCVEDGEKIKACLNEGCTYVAKESIPADGKSHNLGEWEVTIPAKCTVKGEVTQYCQNGDCTHKVTASLKPDGKTHSFAEEFTTIDATCITAGSKFKACENEGCKEVAEKTEIAINPDAHKNVETINVKQPTCEEKGYTGDEFCNDCKKTFEPGIEVDALGHTESDWIVDKEATFTEDGARHTACTVCNKELQKEVIEKRALETPVVKIENTGSGIKVSWSQDEDATGYTVYRSEYNPSTKKWSKWKNRGTAAATKKNWTDKTVKEGVTYRFTVRSVNGDIKSAYKASSGILYVVAPKVTVSITSTGLLAKWNKINNATSYTVYRAELGADGNWGKWVQLGTTKAEKNTWSDTKVQSGVTYKYTVRAVVGEVKSGYTGSSAIIYLEQPLLKISNAANGVTGKWEQVAGATGYTIYRSEYNPSIKKWTKWLNLGTTKATAKSFTDKTAKSGYQYKYTIRAVNGKLKSTYQDSNKLVCLAQPTLKISNVANGIQGKWNQVNGATGYIIYRSELKDGKWTSWTNLGTAKATAKTFTDKTVKSGVQYKYTIRAKNGNYKSSYIDSNSSIFLSIPTVKIANAETGVKVTWGKIDGATSYLVYRSEYNSKTKKWSKWKTLETVDTTSFVDETAVSNVKYKYTVRALNGEFRSYYTASAELLYLKAPTVTAEKIDEGIKVSWTKIEGATSYIIYRSELSKDGKWSKWTKLGTAGEKYTSCKDKTAKEDVTYKYTVRAVNGKLMSYYVASEQILNGVVTESTPEEPKTDVVA